MSETKSHMIAKKKAAGKSGKTEVKISKNRRLDAATKKKATEIERSGTKKGLEKAAERLKDSKRKQKVLQVPHSDLKKAEKAMKKKNVKGSVKNMSSTKRISIKKKK